MISKVENLRVDDPKGSWRALKDILGLSKKRAAHKWEKATDAEGNEHTGDKVKAVVKEAFRRLGIEDVKDTKFDARFAEEVNRQVRRAKAERIQQEELDQKFSMEEMTLPNTFCQHNATCFVTYLLHIRNRLLATAYRKSHFFVATDFGEPKECHGSVTTKFPNTYSLSRIRHNIIELYVQSLLHKCYISLRTCSSRLTEIPIFSLLQMYETQKMSRICFNEIQGYVQFATYYSSTVV